MTGPGRSTKSRVREGRSRGRLTSRQLRGARGGDRLAGSQRTDTVVKRSEYADAGIVHHWIVDATARTLIDCHLAGPFGYQDDGEVTGVFDTTQPCTVRIDLDALG